MDDALKIKMYSFTLDCVDPCKLAEFYAALMGWEMGHSEGFAWTYAPGTEQGSYPFLLFQGNPDYVPPVWPEAPSAQQQMAHLDFAVNDVEKAAEHAISCGATAATQQFSTDWRVMLDPAGHPFCLGTGALGSLL